LYKNQKRIVIEPMLRGVASAKAFARIERIALSKDGCIEVLRRARLGCENTC
jgi:hypothetical protein